MMNYQSPSHSTMQDVDSLDEDEEEANIDQIHSHKHENNTVYYLINYCGHHEQIWVPEHNLSICPQLLEEYLENNAVIDQNPALQEEIDD